MDVSVLDQSPIAEGSTGAQALHNSVDLARLCDSLGYRRYWVAEHHATPALACNAPEVLIAAIASVTRRMRIGSGGIMLPHYSPVKVAEVFSMLAGLHPERIDLGIGRAPGSDQRTAFALQRDRRQRSPDDFPDHLDEMLGYLWQRMPADHPFAKLMETMPGLPHVPEPWLLGSSPQSGDWAAERGLPYVFADFINSGGAPFASRYRYLFTPAGKIEEPRVGVAVWAICAETDAEAERLAASGKMMLAMLHRGQLIPVPSVEKAERWLAELSEVDRLQLARNRRMIVGSPEKVRQGIEDVAKEYNADEVFLVNILHDHAARRRSYELAAEALELKKSSAQAGLAGVSTAG
jgi:luciferase family oxidoreductase group 1